IHWYRVRYALELLRTEEISELDSGHGAARIVSVYEGLVHAPFQREGKPVADREKESQRAARAVGVPVALEIAQVSLQVVVAPQPERSANTHLVDDLQIRFEKHIRRDAHAL